jgi:hypothetical protein
MSMRSAFQQRYSNRVTARILRIVGIAQLGRDFKFAVRHLIKSPVFAIISVTALAFGLGANITIFGFVNAIVLRPLDVPEPDQLVRADAGGENLMPLVLESDCEAYRDRNQSFESLSFSTADGLLEFASTV